MKRCAEEMRLAYQKAEALMPWNLESPVLNGSPNVVWTDAEHFYYNKQTRANGKLRTDFVLVDAKTGEEKPLFDADKLAEQLREEYLPFQNAKYADKFIDFTAKKHDYSYDIEVNALFDLGVHKQETAAPSPDKKLEAFTKDNDLWLRDLISGEEKRLTYDGTEDFAYGAEASQINVMRARVAGIPPRTGVLWSHDSTRFLTYKLDLRGIPEFHILQCYDEEGRESIRPRLLNYKCSLPEDDRMPFAYLYLYDTVSGRMTKIDSAPIAVCHFVLNPSFCMAQWTKNDEYIWYTSTERWDKDGYLHVIKAADGTVTTPVHEHSDLFLNLGTYGLYDGYGAYPYSNYLTEDGKTAIWQSEREGAFRYYRIDVQTGEVLNPITPGDSLAENIIRVDEAGQWIYYLAAGLAGCSNPYYRCLCRVHFDGTGFAVLTPEDGEHSVHMGSDYFTDTWSRVDKPPVTTVRRCDGTLMFTLCESDITELLAKGYILPERFCVTASDGKTPIYGLLIRPADCDPAKKYPVIDYAYGGMQCHNVPQAFTWKVQGGREIFGGLQSFAQLGIAGFMIDGLGTPGRGMEIHKFCYENIHGCAGLKDHIYARAELQQKYPFLDFTRSGIWGNSGGACASVRAMLEFPDAYQVAVASAGNHDQRMYDNMWTERYYGPYNPEIYKKGDNTALAANLKGKLFLVHGMMDCNVNYGESIRLIDALIRADKTFDWLTLPRTNHNVPGNPYFIRRKLDYFVKYLLEEDVPADYHFAVDNLLDKTFE